MGRGRVLPALLLACAWLGGSAAAAEAGPGALQVQYEALRDSLSLTSNHYGAPLHVRSGEDAARLEAEILGVVPHAMARVSALLTQPGGWCELALLTFNVKACTFAATGTGAALTFYVGRKFYDSPEQAHQLEYRYRIERREADYLRVGLSAEHGPLGTSDYRIEVEAVPLDAGTTLLRFRSSHRSSLRSALATRAYLATAGRDKVGFSIVGTDAVTEAPVLVQGVRGIIERNAMRYYLALSACLDALELPAGARLEARLHTWFDLVERHPRQLRELEREEYLQAKRREWMNQQARQSRLSPVPLAAGQRDSWSE